MKLCATIIWKEALSSSDKIRFRVHEILNQNAETLFKTLLM